VGPRAVLDAVVNRKMPSHCQDSNSRSSSTQSSATPLRHPGSCGYDVWDKERTGNSGGEISWKTSSSKTKEDVRMGLRDIGREGGTSSGSCSTAVFGTTCVEPSGPAIAVFCVYRPIKVKLSPCFLSQAPRHEGVLGEWRYSSTHSLTSTLDGSEWSASHPGHFTPRVRAPGTHWVRG
jgi:hypothetical protein